MSTSPSMSCFGSVIEPDEGFAIGADWRTECASWLTSELV